MTKREEIVGFKKFKIGLGIGILFFPLVGMITSLFIFGLSYLYSDKQVLSFWPLALGSSICMMIFAALPFAMMMSGHFYKNAPDHICNEDCNKLTEPYIDFDGSAPFI